jgi:hypothetical protein
MARSKRPWGCRTFRPEVCRAGDPRCHAAAARAIRPEVEMETVPAPRPECDREQGTSRAPAGTRAVRSPRTRSSTSAGPTQTIATAVVPHRLRTPTKRIQRRVSCLSECFRRSFGTMEAGRSFGVLPRTRLQTVRATTTALHRRRDRGIGRRLAASHIAKHYAGPLRSV